MATRTSTASGNWNNPATWGGNIPGSGDKAVIASAHTVYLNVNTQVMGVLVNGTLEYAASTSATLTTNRNVEVRNGTLRMRPSSASITHKIQFIDINNNAFVGGGDEVIESDVGLWVRENGRLDILGAAKRRWTRAVGGINQGATSCTVQDATGWQIGDEVGFVTMDTPSQETFDWDDATNSVKDEFSKRSERRNITNITGNTISWVGGLSYNHPIVTSNVSDPDLGTSNKIWYPEVANLSTNVKMHGQPGKHYHIFVKANVPQSVYYLEQQYVGVRKLNPARHSSRPELVSGRYGFHYHHSEEGARASINFGGVIKDAGNRCYVVHGSHGVTQNNNVVWQSMESAFWWDFQHITHDCVWEDNLFVNITRNGLDAVSQGMLLQMGDGNAARRNVGVYACSGDAHSGGVYTWIDDTEGIWIFEDNLSHSSSQGLFVWQNTSFNHTIINYCCFNCYEGINHGAYINSYTYRYGHLHNAPIHMKATSGNTSGVAMIDMFFHGGGRQYCGDYIDSPVPSDPSKTNKFIRCVFTGYTLEAMHLHTDMEDSNVEKQYKHIDFIRCKFQAGGKGYHWHNKGGEYNLKNNWRVRVQPISGQCYQTQRINGQDVNSNISAFAPTVYNDGTGLMGTYYNGTNFNSFAFKRLDSMIMFEQWTMDPKMAAFGVHHLIIPKNTDFYSAVWTGKIMPQFTEQHRFAVKGGSSFKLWINGNQLLNRSEHPDNDVITYSSPVNMTVGVKYDIRLEITNSGGARGALLYWESPSMQGLRNVPQSQLFTGLEGGTTLPPTTFQATTKPITTAPPPTVPPTTAVPTTVPPPTTAASTIPPTTIFGQTTLPQTTVAPTVPPTTVAPTQPITTAPVTTVPQTTYVPPTTQNPFTMAYNPSLHTVTNKSMGISAAAPIDARSYFYDENLFLYRPFQSKAEALAYLDTAPKRKGHFPVFINEGGVLANGVFTGGTIRVMYFRNGVNDSNLTDAVEAIRMKDVQDKVWIFRVSVGGVIQLSEDAEANSGGGHQH